MTGGGQLALIAAEAVAELGDGWKVTGAGAVSAGLGHTDGRSILLDGREAGPRIVVSGCYPPGEGGYGDRHWIRVTADKGGDHVGREIRRRLLPGYDPDYAAAVARVAEYAADAAGRAATAERLAAIPGVRPASNHGSRHNPEVYVAGGDARGRVTVKSDGSRLKVTLDDVPAEVGVRMLAMLAEAVDG